MQNKGKYFFIVGGVLALLGAATNISQIKICEIYISPVIFSLGVIFIIISRYLQPIKGDNFRMKRLKFQQFLSTCLLIASAYLMFVGDNRWYISLIIAALLDFVVAMRAPNQQKDN